MYIWREGLGSLSFGGRQHLDSSALGEDLIVVVRFLGLLPELVLCFRDAQVMFCLLIVGTIIARLILHPSPVQDPPRFLTLPMQDEVEYC